MGRTRVLGRHQATERDTLSKAVARTVAMIGDAVPGLTVARDLLDRFHRMIRHRKDKRLDEGLADAQTGLDVFVCHRNRAGLRGGEISSRTEEQNTRLKLVRRQMFGRVNLDLLRARPVGVAENSQ